MYMNTEGLTGCLVVLLVLALIGLIALCIGGWWLFSNVSFSWGG